MKLFAKILLTVNYFRKTLDLRYLKGFWIVSHLAQGHSYNVVTKSCKELWRRQSLILRQCLTSWLLHYSLKSLVPLLRIIMNSVPLSKRKRVLNYFFSLKNILFIVNKNSMYKPCKKQPKFFYILIAKLTLYSNMLCQAPWRDHASGGSNNIYTYTTCFKYVMLKIKEILFFDPSANWYKTPISLACILEHVSTSTMESWKTTVFCRIGKVFEREPGKFPWHGFS